MIGTFKNILKNYTSVSQINVNQFKRPFSIARYYYTSNGEKQYTVVDIDINDKPNTLKNNVKVGMFNFHNNDLTLDSIINQAPDDLVQRGKFYRLSKGNGNYIYHVSFDNVMDSVDFFKKCKEEADKNVHVYHTTRKLSYPFVSIMKNSLDKVQVLTSEQIQELPIPTTPSTIVSHPGMVEDAIKLLLGGKTIEEVESKDYKGEIPVIGMDCEWPGLRKYLLSESPMVSLIQLSNGVHTVLFRMNLIGIDKGSSLIQLLTSSKVLKVGFGIGKDANKLQKDHEFFVDNIVDVKYLQPVKVLQKKTFVDVAAFYCKVNLNRSKTTNISNWATTGDLSPIQIKTASNNCFYGRELYFLLKDQKTGFEGIL